MKIDNEYVISTLKKSKATNAKSIMFFIPFITLLITIVFSLTLPTYNHYKTINNGNHSYVYGVDKDSYEELGVDSNAFYYDRNIMSHMDEELKQGGFEVYYEYTQMANLYICRNSIDVNKTMFTDENVLEKIDVGDEPNVWLSYELAKSLYVDIGDTIYLRAVKYPTIPVEFEAKVSGITRTKYSDQAPIKSSNHVGSGIMFLDDETFNWFMDETHFNSNYKVIFSEEKMPNLSDYEMVSKETQIEEAEKYIKDNGIKAAFIVIFALGLLYIILSFEMSFTEKSHNSNMIILNMLGVPIKKIRSIFVKSTLINFLISAIISLLLVKFVFMQELLKIYVEWLPLLIAFIVLMVFSTLFACIYSLKIKKL